MRLNGESIAIFTAMLFVCALPATAADSLGSGRSSQFQGELNVDSVVRKSGVVTVKSTVKNNDKSTESVTTCEHSYLLDPEKGIKYESLKDEKGTTIGSSGVYVPEENSRPIWCKFPAPPNEVKVIGYVHTGFEAIEDLPITDK